MGEDCRVARDYMTERLEGLCPERNGRRVEGRENSFQDRLKRSVQSPGTVELLRNRIDSTGIVGAAQHGPNTVSERSFNDMTSILLTLLQTRLREPGRSTDPRSHV